MPLRLPVFLIPAHRILKSSAGGITFGCAVNHVQELIATPCRVLFVDVISRFVDDICGHMRPGNDFHAIERPSIRRETAFRSVCRGVILSLRVAHHVAAHYPKSDVLHTYGFLKRIVYILLYTGMPPKASLTIIYFAWPMQRTRRNPYRAVGPRASIYSIGL